MPKPNPQPKPTRDELLAILERMRANLTQRKAKAESIPQRGKTRVPRKKLYEYQLHTSGVTDLLRGISEGRLELITRDCVDALIDEFTSPSGRGRTDAGEGSRRMRKR